jgi:serine/threonine-protein kinase
MKGAPLATLLPEAAERAAAGASSTPPARVYTDAADHDLVQRRVALLFTVTGAVALGFFALIALYIALAFPWSFVEVHTTPPKLLHLGSGLVFLALGAYCRRGPRSRAVIAAVDLGGTFTVSVLMSAVVASSAPGLRSEYMSSVAFMLVATLRAALVPSPPGWTRLVVALAAIPIPLGAYAAAMRDTTWADHVVPRTSALVVSSGWCAAAIGAAWTVSWVVYGLRTEVKTALRLGQYTLEEKIGEGGMGVVYRARHALLRRPTAIKLLPPERTSPNDVRRFEREVQLTSSLTHPNTIAIYDFGHTRDGVFYYVMELVDGASLQELVDREGRQPEGRAVHVAAQIASALAEAHEVGLIHRDIKPANILLCERGGIPDFVKVLDFGLVKEVGSSDPALSSADAIAGTPLYMAPESITSADGVDARADLYALGGVLYFLLTGAPPFEGTNLVEICSHHLHTPPTPPSRRIGRLVHPDVERIVLACLAKPPDQRPASARALASELRRLAATLGWSPGGGRGTEGAPDRAPPTGFERTAPDGA